MSDNASVDLAIENRNINRYLLIGMALLCVGILYAGVALEQAASARSDLHRTVTTNVATIRANQAKVRENEGKILALQMDKDALETQIRSLGQQPVTASPPPPTRPVPRGTGATVAPETTTTAPPSQSPQPSASTTTSTTSPTTTSTTTCLHHPLTGNCL